MPGIFLGILQLVFSGMSQLRLVPIDYKSTKLVLPYPQTKTSTRQDLD